MFPIKKHYILHGGYKPGKIEKMFEAEIMKKLRAEGFITFHPQDVGLAGKFLDCHIVSPEGNLHWIEFKKIQGATFNISKFEQSQIFLLRELDKRNPDVARVYIYSVKARDYKVFTFTELWEAKNSKGGIKIF